MPITALKTQPWGSAPTISCLVDNLTFWLMWHLVWLHAPSQSQTQLNFVEVRYSLEQYIGLKEDKLSSTTVDFIRSEGNLETKHLYWFSKPKMC